MLLVDGVLKGRMLKKSNKNTYWINFTERVKGKRIQEFYEIKSNDIPAFITVLSAKKVLEAGSISQDK